MSAPTAQARMLLLPTCPVWPMNSRSQSKPRAVAGISHVEVVASFIAARVEIARIIELEARVVRRQLAGSDVLPLDPEPSELEVIGREVVERVLVAILDGATPERDDAPEIPFPVEPHGVKRLLDVRTIAYRDEAMQVEGHLLSSDAGFHRRRRQRGRCRR